MKKIVCTLLIALSLFPGVTFAADAYKPITDKDLPLWIPTDAEIRANMVRIFNSAIDMYNVRAAGYTITRAWIDGKTVWIHLERASISADIQIGEFEKIESVAIVNSILKVKYRTTEDPPFGWKEFALGGLAGAALVFLGFSLAKN